MDTVLWLYMESKKKKKSKTKQTQTWDAESKLVKYAKGLKIEDSKFKIY